MTVFATVDALPSPAASSSLAAAPAAGDVPGAVVFNGAMTMTDNSASYGGSLALCGVPVSLSAAASSSVSGSSASRSGGGVFVCLPAGTLPLADADNPPAARSIEDIPWLALGGGVLPSALFSGSVASGFGPIVASPPRTLAWSGSGARSLGPLDRATGFSLGTEAAVGLADVFGQTVIDAGIRLSMGVPLSAPGGVVLAGGDRSRLMDGAVVSFATVKALAVDSNALDGLSSVTYPLEVRVVNAPTVAKVALTVQIRSCGLGEGLVSLSGLPLECTVCSEGTFSNAVSLEACVACPVGAFNLKKGATSCESCPANAFRDVERRNTTLAGSTVPCVCKVGYYALSGETDVPCRACPNGASCVGGTEPPKATPGYYPVGSARFEACRLPGICLGGDPPRCVAGHHGSLCAVCQRDYHVNKRGTCTKCPDVAPVLASIVIVVVAIAAATAGLVVATTIRSTRNDDDNDVMATAIVKWATSTPRSVVVAFLFFPVLGVLVSINVGWPSEAQSAMGGFDVFNMDAAVVINECTMPSLYVKYDVLMMRPVLLVSLCVLVSGCLLWRAHASFEPQLASRSLVASISPLVYLPLSRAALSVFDCTRLYNGKWLLDADMRHACFDGTWWAVATFGVVCTMAFVVGIPCGCWWILRNAQRDEALFHPWVLKEIGGLYRSRVSFEGLHALRSVARGRAGSGVHSVRLALALQGWPPAA